MQRRLLGLDYESYYCSKTKYSLRSMDAPSYLCDPRFEDIGVAVRHENEKPYFVDAVDYPAFYKWLGDPTDITMYGHNLMFDACLASWRHGFRPGLYICTLNLSRQLLAKDLRSLALASVAKHLGLKPKGDTIVKVDGMRRANIIAAGLWQDYANYATDDIDISHDILMWALPQISADELVIADMVLRMATEPSFVLDRKMLDDYYVEVVNEKQALVQHAMQVSGLTSQAELMSNDKFALVLENLGVEPPTKISPATSEETWAFAKSDEGLKALQDHEDPAVQAVVAARLGVKSTIEETRTRRYANIATLNFPQYGTGLFPVPLKVSGAHTHRLSGDWKLNAQNMKRNSKVKRSKLRASLRAPEGYTVVVGDESQIEARMTAVFSGQWDLVEQFRTKQDPYALMATTIFGYPVNKSMEAERFVGKQCVLSAQYGVGHIKFRSNTIYQAREQAGIDISGLLTADFAERTINAYRTATIEITRMREQLHGCLQLMTSPTCNFTIGPVRFLYQKIEGPTGLCLHYKDLQQVYSKKNNKFEWVYQHGGIWKRIYGGKLLENIIQFLARCVVMQAALRLRPAIMASKGAMRLALQAHDELVLVVRNDWVPYAKQLLEAELTRQVSWMPELPVACEIGTGPTYGDAK